jgi:hypothetical protein
VNASSPTSVLIAACKQGYRLFQRLGPVPAGDPLEGCRQVFDIRPPLVAEVVDFAGRRPVNPDTECEVLVEAYGTKQWVRDWAQSVFVAGNRPGRR